jgi:hypothetical protein
MDYESASHSSLRLKDIGIDSRNEHMVFMRRDCPVCISEGFEALSRVRVASRGVSLAASLIVVDDPVRLAVNELGLSTGAMLFLNAKGETRISPEPAKTDFKEISDDSAGTITVYKSPTCGCCSMWESHLTRAGFRLASKPTDNRAEIRKQHNVPDKMQSCHTAVVDGFVIEGHVPADDVKKLLNERPANVVGLAAPGMPKKSPGMQPEGEKPADYNVFSFDKEGNTKVFASY